MRKSIVSGLGMVDAGKIFENEMSRKLNACTGIEPEGVSPRAFLKFCV